MIRREPDRARGFSHDRPYKLKRDKAKPSASPDEQALKPDSEKG